MSKNQIVGFKPARLQESAAGSQVVYYAENPVTEKLERVRIKLNHIKDPAQRKKYAKKVIAELNNKLFEGWNPWEEHHLPKGNQTLVSAMERFIKRKSAELRPDSMRSYRSYVAKLTDWLENTNRKDLFCARFSKDLALEYMNWISDQDYAARTYNNYLIFMQGFFTWLQENRYVNDNHFLSFKKVRKEVKEREPIPVDVRERITSHLEESDYNFLIVCMLVFHSLIRPKEVSELKPSDFQLKRQIITIRAEVAKNGKKRITTIPDAFLPFLLNWDFNNARANEYIFGTNFIAGPVPVNSRRFSKKWDVLRTKMKLPMSMKLYSLRDSGIIQMLQDGISPEEVMKQADHSSLEITSIYAKHINPEGSEQIKRKGSNF